MPRTVPFECPGMLDTKKCFSCPLPDCKLPDRLAPKGGITLEIEYAVGGRVPHVFLTEEEIKAKKRERKRKEQRIYYARHKEELNRKQREKRKNKREARLSG